jgi:hypothetical protein
MQNIQILNKQKNGSKLYYIAVLDSSTSQTVNKIASSFKKIVEVINYKATTVSPNDITIKDIQNFGSPAITKCFEYNDATIYGPYQNGYYQFYCNFYYTNHRYYITYPAFVSSDLQSLGGLLKKLIKNAHSHG